MLIHDVCRECSITKKALEYYLEQNLVSPQTMDNGYRNFSPEDILQIKKISTLRRLGLSVSEIRQVLISTTFDKLNEISDYKKLDLFFLQEKQLLIKELASNANWDEIRTKLSLLEKKETLEYQKVFDSVPEKYDKWRPRYCQDAFDKIINICNLNTNSSVLEIGPGTGQATEPILKTGCNYLSIELGKNFTSFNEEKFRTYSNFNIINADFQTYNFAAKKFDLIYSAATMQWIPEQIGFSKSYELLKPGGIFAMLYTVGEYKTSNEVLYNKIQQVYNNHFYTHMPYTQRIKYENVQNYGFTNLECYKYSDTRELTADEFVEYLGAHSDHILLYEEEKEAFFEGIRNAILEEGNKLIFHDTIVLYIAHKI